MPDPAPLQNTLIHPLVGKWCHQISDGIYSHKYIEKDCRILAEVASGYFLVEDWGPPHPCWYPDPAAPSYPVDMVPLSQMIVPFSKLLGWEFYDTREAWTAKAKWWAEDLKTP